MPQPGWYRDPWDVVPLRWWDGYEWTAATAGPPPYVEDVVHRRVASSHRQARLGRFLGVADRLVVIDVETTGLYSSDRVVEVAMVTLDGVGDVVEEFETLLDPQRDIGPTEIHGITASMVADAPLFGEVAAHLAALMDNAVCVAHNLPFDRRMLGSEFDRAGIEIGWGEGLDTLRATGCKLGVACNEHGIELPDAHRALNDARATASLLKAVAGEIGTKCFPVRARCSPVGPARILTRDVRGTGQAPRSYLASLARSVHAAAEVAPYVDLLDSVVADLRLTDEERSELIGMAEELGLNEAQVAAAHHEFVDGLIDAALEDSILTDAEFDQVCRAAALLEVDRALVERRTSTYRATPQPIPLSVGLTVCFTGSAVTHDGEAIPRSQLNEAAAANGLTVTSTVTAKGCDLVVAADPASQSGKADKARKLGIPITSVQEFLDSLETGEPLAATKYRKAGVALVCSKCGTSWVAARRSKRPICRGCRG